MIDCGAVMAGRVAELSLNNNFRREKESLEDGRDGNKSKSLPEKALIRQQA